MSIQRVSVLAVAVAAVFLLGGWADQGPAQAKKDEAKDERGGQGDVTLRMEGDQGVRFSGACSVGEERREIEGQTPQSFEFDLKGRKLSCEIGKRGSEGAGFEVVLSDGNVRSVQRLGGVNGTVRLTYDGGGSLSSMSSSLQTVNSAPDASPPKADDAGLENLADRIERRVDDILERIIP